MRQYNLGAKDPTAVLVDDQQDLEERSYEEIDGWTILKFTRLVYATDETDLVIIYT